MGGGAAEAAKSKRLEETSRTPSDLLAGARLEDLDGQDVGRERRKLTLDVVEDVPDVACRGIDEKRYDHLAISGDIDG